MGLTVVQAMRLYTESKVIADRDYIIQHVIFYDDADRN